MWIQLVIFFFSLRLHTWSPVLVSNCAVVCRASRVIVPNLAQVPNCRTLVKTSLELQSCSLFQINRLDQR
jgi:hypothetical protein